MIEIDYSWFSQFQGTNIFLVGLILIFKYYLWIPLLYFILKFIVYPLYIYSRQTKYSATQEYMFLAVDVPKDNEQSIQAMEQVFVQLLGGHGTCTKIEKYWEGWFQVSFSFEIVSIDGYIQYVIRSPKKFRDLVESSIYAQYPDAEITEVEDYTGSVPENYPNETHELFGAEFVLDNDNFMPIRTYGMFEHDFSKIYIDPLAALLESMSKLGQGEQLWIQLLAKPLGVDWAKDGENYVKKMIGSKVSVKQGLIAGTFEKLLNLVGEFFGALIGYEMGAGESEKKDDAPSMMMHLSPGQKEKVELVEKKISKMAYSMKMRMIYVAEKDKFVKTRGIHPIIGAIKQFGLLGSNGLKPEMKYSTLRAKYFMKDRRNNYQKELFYRAFRKRAGDIGRKPWIFNVEELASFYHFPSAYVKAPLIKTTEIKKTEPPSSLPYELSFGEEEDLIVPEPDVFDEAQAITTTFDYDNDDFEKRFAKDKEMYEQKHQIRMQKESADAEAMADEGNKVVALGEEHPDSKATDDEEKSVKLNKKKTKEKKILKEIIQPQAGEVAQKKEEYLDQLRQAEVPPEDDKLSTPTNLPFVD